MAQFVAVPEHNTDTSYNALNAPSLHFLIMNVWVVLVRSGGAGVILSGVMPTL